MQTSRKGDPFYHRCAWSLTEGCLADTARGRVPTLSRFSLEGTPEQQDSMEFLPQTRKETALHMLASRFPCPHMDTQTRDNEGTLWTDASKWVSVKSSTCPHSIRDSCAAFINHSFLRSKLPATRGVFSAQKTKFSVDILEHQWHFSVLVEDGFGSHHDYVLPKHEQ